MKIQRAYKTELDPNNEQRTALLRHAGAARWAYNYGLRRKIDVYKETGRSPSAIDLHRELNALKRKPVEEGGVPWMYEVSKAAPQEALRHLDRAFEHFFRRCKNGAKIKGFPRFKSRKRGVGGFRLTGAIRATFAHVRLPRLGSLRLKENGYLPTTDREDVKVLSASVSEKAGRWFVSLQVEQEVPEPVPTAEQVVGVDVGVRSLAITSDGEVFENPKALRGAEGRLRMLQKSVSRKVGGSKNRQKAVAKVARQHYRLSCVRKDAIHQATSAITKSASVIVLESLNLAGMLGNRCLSKALSDASLAELHRQLDYKARWRGVRVIRADHWFPSSKRCSSCGAVKTKLGLGEREYVCDVCGVVLDRDINAALNLKQLTGSSPVTACGEASSGSGREIRAKLASLKQEPNTRVGRCA